ncbi:hypothetical protein [Psychrosphaera haliotis]|uniref:Nuclear transport factor 2 family protein n=1 Tax=Psychrosphaera haliotis TaxID=555083 RepID=A0A6N8F9N3_9GAMM|nr:hypothetical protein [Psychrosphaera haliotis]MUH73216.1 hypothetical protein [Psychrosphaera haliotis]
MSDCIKTFFKAWQIEDEKLRFSTINSSVVEAVKYDDPRTPETINGIESLNNYVGMFSAHAPGWAAKVIKADSIAGVTRVTVAFSGPGPEGTEQTQLGQYFVEQDGDLICRMVGFVGIGE